MSNNVEYFGLNNPYQIYENILYVKVYESRGMPIYEKLGIIESKFDNVITYLKEK